MIRKVLIILPIVTIITLLILALPQLINKNTGESTSTGTPAKGSIQNAWLIPYNGTNYKYFSLISYYLMDNGYLHSSAHKTLLDSYEICSKTCPDITFGIMECSNKTGGKMRLHNTHRNGLSVDFMVPLINEKGETVRRYARRGLRHYLLEFDKDGYLISNPNIKIDFETMAKHIFSLHESGKKHNTSIKKVIFKINLKDNLFKTPTGKILQQKNIYFAQALPENIDKYHDDHYHIDFQLKK